MYFPVVESWFGSVWVTGGNKICVCICVWLITSCKPALWSPCCGSYYLLAIRNLWRTEIGGRGWENNIWRSERGLFWLFGILMLPISSVMFGWLFWPFNPGGTQLATSWKMCIITTLGLVCNKHASTQGHTFKRALMNIHTHAQDLVF